MVLLDNRYKSDTIQFCLLDQDSLSGSLLVLSYPFLYFIPGEAVTFARLFLRGFAEWIFLIGVYGVTRELVQTNHSWIAKLRRVIL